LENDIPHNETPFTGFRHRKLFSVDPEDQLIQDEMENNDSDEDDKKKKPKDKKDSKEDQSMVDA